MYGAAGTAGRGHFRQSSPANSALTCSCLCPTGSGVCHGCSAVHGIRSCEYLSTWQPSVARGRRTPQLLPDKRARGAIGAGRCGRSEVAFMPSLLALLNSEEWLSAPSTLPSPTLTSSVTHVALHPLPPLTAAGSCLLVCLFAAVCQRDRRAQRVLDQQLQMLWQMPLDRQGQVSVANAAHSHRAAAARGCCPLLLLLSCCQGLAAHHMASCHCTLAGRPCCLVATHPLPAPLLAQPVHVRQVWRQALAGAVEAVRAVQRQG